jgi:hypothetical protein
MPRQLDATRTKVLEWLRAPKRDPNFLGGVADLENHHGEIAQRFMKWAAEAGFGYQIVRADGAGAPGYEVHWTHRGSSFVGFKQPQPEATPEDALLAGCAALLTNDWCRERLPR